ncbi:MAG TPA: hypothetical protein PLL69_10430, partial [Gemmatimonadales bacterium]|nr:hypothetical protein [Gemmatimonadales bacterium]
MIRVLLLSLSLIPLVGTLQAQKRPAERRCLLEILNVDREGTRTQFGSQTNYAAGGNVRLRCQKQQVFMQGDSLEAIAGEWIRLITGAQYRDEDVTIDADTLTYLRSQETLQARGSVRVVTLSNGSTLEGPYVDHFRAVRGVRDSSETVAMQRPRVEYQVARGAGDSAQPSPYIIVADGLRGRGTSQLTGWGDVTVDRDSMAGRGDSLKYAKGEFDQFTLIGNLASLVRSGEDSFSVRGRNVILQLQGQDLRRVQAIRDGHVVGQAGEITSENASLDFADGMLVGTTAWGREGNANVVADGYDVRGDSVEIDTPSERLRELRVFGNGRLVEPCAAPPDSAIAAVPDSLLPAADSVPPEPICNTITGSRVTVRFVDHDSSGTLLTQLSDITAIGSA